VFRASVDHKTERAIVT